MPPPSTVAELPLRVLAVTVTVPPVVDAAAEFGQATGECKAHEFDIAAGVDIEYPAPPPRINGGHAAVRLDGHLAGPVADKELSLGQRVVPGGEDDRVGPGREGRLGEGTPQAGGAGRGGSRVVEAVHRDRRQQRRASRLSTPGRRRLRHGDGPDAWGWRVVRRSPAGEPCDLENKLNSESVPGILCERVMGCSSRGKGKVRGARDGRPGTVPRSLNTGRVNSPRPGARPPGLASLSLSLCSWLEMGVWQRFATKWAIVFTDSSHRPAGVEFAFSVETRPQRLTQRRADDPLISLTRPAFSAFSAAFRSLAWSRPKANRGRVCRLIANPTPVISRVGEMGIGSVLVLRRERNRCLTRLCRVRR